MSSAPRSEPLRAAVVGCGAIGGEIDEARPGQDPVTHAGSYAAHPGFVLAACVEPDPARRSGFAAHWKVGHAFADLESLLAAGPDIDVVSLCSPTDHHAEALERLLASPVKAVFAEKPLTGDPAIGRRLVEAYAAAGKPLLVNFTRRWNRTFMRLKEEIARGEWGRPLSAVGVYTKGIRHNGGHLVDLLAYFLGPLSPVAVTGARLDHWSDDPTVDALLLSAEGTPVHLCGGDARAYSTFELTLLLERGAMAIESGGLVLRTRRTAPNPFVPGQADLAPGGTAETEWRTQFLAALDDLAHAVATGAEPVSSGHSALTAQILCSTLAEMAPIPKEATP